MVKLKQQYKPLQLTNDLAMKRAFGNEQYPEHLLGLIETITGRRYESIRILNPYNESEFKDEWHQLENLPVEDRFFYSISDIQAQTESEDYIIVEMQRFYDPYFRARLWTQLCQKILSQRRPGQSSEEFYAGIRPIHVIAIQDYIDPEQKDTAVKTHSILPDYLQRNPNFRSGLATISFFSLKNTKGTNHAQRNLQRLFNNQRLQGKVDLFMTQVKEYSNYLDLSPSEKTDYDRLAERVDQSRRIRKYFLETGRDAERMQVVQHLHQNGMSKEEIHQMIGYDRQLIEQILKQS